MTHPEPKLSDRMVLRLVDAHILFHSLHRLEACQWHKVDAAAWVMGHGLYSLFHAVIGDSYDDSYGLRAKRYWLQDEVYELVAGSAPTHLIFWSLVSMAQERKQGWPHVLVRDAMAGDTAALFTIYDTGLEADIEVAKALLKNCGFRVRERGGPTRLALGSAAVARILQAMTPDELLAWLFYCSKPGRRPSANLLPLVSDKPIKALEAERAKLLRRYKARCARYTSLVRRLGKLSGRAKRSARMSDQSKLRLSTTYNLLDTELAHFGALLVADQQIIRAVDRYRANPCTASTKSGRCTSCHRPYSRLIDSQLGVDGQLDIGAFCSLPCLFVGIWTSVGFE